LGSSRAGLLRRTGTALYGAAAAAGWRASAAARGPSKIRREEIVAAAAPTAKGRQRDEQVGGAQLEIVHEVPG